MKRFTKLIIIGACVAAFSACGSSSDNSSSSNSTPSTEAAATTTDASESAVSEEPVEISEEPAESEDVADEELTYGSVFEFDGLEICFSSDVEFGTVDNQYSDKNGAEVVIIPVSIKNISGETNGLNMFYYTIYGSQGTKASTAGSYFDNDVDYAGDMRSGASMDTYFHIIYDGDGDYYIEFDNYTEELEVRLPVSK